MQLAEELGIGNVMLSERPDYKEASAICGALAAVTERIFIGTSATNLNTRYPVIGAAMASTLHRISEVRFALGLAKGGGKARCDAWGLRTNTWAREEAYVDPPRIGFFLEYLCSDGSAAAEHWRALFHKRLRRRLAIFGHHRARHCPTASVWFWPGIRRITARNVVVAR